MQAPLPSEGERMGKDRKRGQETSGLLSTRMLCGRYTALLIQHLVSKNLTVGGINKYIQFPIMMLGDAVKSKMFKYAGQGYRQNKGKLSVMSLLWKHKSLLFPQKGRCTME